MISLKRGFSTKDFVIASLLFTGIVALMVIGLADIQGNYPNSPDIVDPTFSANYDKLTEQTASLNTMRETALSGEGLSFRGTFDVTFGSFFTIMQITFSSLALFGTIFLNIPTDFPFISQVVVSTFFIIGLSAVTVILLFKLINAVGRNPV